MALLRSGSARPLFFGSASIRPSMAFVLAVLVLMAVAFRPESVSGRAAVRQAATGGQPIRVLFLGQDQERPHDPARMYPYLAAPLARKGIQVTYVSTPAEALDPARLRYYDALLIYGNHETLSPEQEKVLLDFVEGGKGLVALHSASAEFTNSDKYLALVGAQFQRHGTGDFTADIVQPAHPVMQGIQPFSTWDETYVHSRHNADGRTVLMERAEGTGREPWTWVRTQGRGRVFYTAYGHDERTFGKPQFQHLVENAITWVVDEPARQAHQRLEMPSLVYLDGYNVPNYEGRDPAPKFQLPLAASEATKFIQSPAEFDVQLFASEPEVVKPIAMAFDERGRLWVIEAHDYPNEVLMGNPGDDKVKILEDTNNDGRADKVTVFAEGINQGTSLVFANGGVIVSAAPHMFFFKDTNGDDKADVKQILSTGWGTRDSHAVPSSLQYGPDNYVWGVVGYSGFDGEMNGKRMTFTQGAYRFKPDGSKFEYMVQSTNNTWGLGFNESFDVFGSTANGDPSWHMGIPARYFDGVQGLTTGGRGAGQPGYMSLAQFTGIHYTTPYIRQVDNMGYYTAGAGHMFYTARQFPKSYWNRTAFVTEPTVHVAGQVNIEPQGSGYVAKDGWNLMSSAEEWFAPVAAQVGPDGSVFALDFYNFIAQHNPTPVGFSVGRGAAYETSMRDHIRGRIYRVSYKGAAAAPRRSLSKSDPAGLVQALSSDNMLWRLTAQRLLVERGQKDVVPQLVALVRNRAVDEIGISGGPMHALWTLHGLGELDTTTTEAYRAAVEALKHPSAAVRKAAAQVLPLTATAGTALLGSGILQDADLHTRLAAVLVLADMPTSAPVAQAVYRASQISENYTDQWLSRALYVAATRHQQEFLTVYKADRNAVPFSGLSVPLRMGAATPDWRLPAAAEMASDWKDMALPGAWETRGLAAFDGTVWFSRTVDVVAGAAPETLSLGPVRNQAMVWLNGIALTPQPAASAAPAPAPAPAAAAPAGGAAAAPAGRGAVPAGAAGGTQPNAGIRLTAAASTAQLVFAVPAGAFRTGANTITVRVTNTRAEGGFIGAATDMFMQRGQTRTSLAGTWKYRVERPAGAGVVYGKPGELAAHVAFTAAGGPSGAAGAALPTVVSVPDVTLQLNVVPNEMKFAQTQLTVQAGQLVELVFVNADQMQHNFVLGAQGTLQVIGAAADQFATQAGAAAAGYVPDIQQILVKTPLVNPDQTLRVQFRAPAEAGQYPYVCTFPGHWRLMNGILTVTPLPAGRGAGPGGRAAGPAPAPAGTPAAPAGRGQ